MARLSADFKSKAFVRVADKLALKDTKLRKAVEAAENGQIDGDLGGSVIKQRVARDGEGKSGGFRAIILFKSGKRAFFVYAFAKNEHDNIPKSDLKVYKKLAEKTLALDDGAIATLIATGVFIEVANEGDNENN